jgi:hypothetical protein
MPEVTPVVVSEYASWDHGGTIARCFDAHPFWCRYRHGLQSDSMRHAIFDGLIENRNKLWEAEWTAYHARPADGAERE